MLGFHSDGIRLFGASDTLKANLKKKKTATGWQHYRQYPGICH